MKVQQHKKHLLIIFMAGFLIGILYTNIISRQYITVSGIFNEYYLRQYVNTEVIAAEYIWYILPMRAGPFIALAVLGYTKLKKIAVIGYLLWTGFSVGVIAVSAVIQMGMRGILLFIVGIIPQFIFYILAYTIVLWYLYTYPDAKWNSGKTTFVFLTLVMGILMEVYVNPGLMRMFIQTL